MKIRFAIVLVMLVIAPEFALLGQEPDWLVKMKKIKLLTDSYEDVVTLLGTPVDGTVERELSEYFDLPDGRLWVGFASGLCVVTPYSGGAPTGWKVPEWKVTSVSFRPNRPISLKKLKLDFSGYVKSPIDDVPGAFIYRNDALGVEYSVTSRRKIEEIEFFPSTKFAYLQCTG
ncbi:MAG: hypothetical protein ABI857_09405 [Acidobacteriota bacterium]